MKHPLRFSLYVTCLVGKCAIIQASIRQASWRNSDTLIRFEIQGGFVKI